MGIIIFMIWVALFWGLMFKVLVPADTGKDEGPKPGDSEGENGHIKDEREPMTPGDPGTNTEEGLITDNG